MDKHFFFLLIFLASAVLIAGVFISAYRSSLKVGTEASGMKNPNKKRFLFFSFLLAIIIILLSVTLPKSPYFLLADSEPSKVVFVAAKQFYFFMSSQAIDPNNPDMSETIELPANQTVEFRVSSLDVNHGFAIYNQEGELIAQTQAMPGYVNRLRWKFDKPGTYNILCLEFCGLAHAIMRSSFTVK